MFCFHKLNLSVDLKVIEIDTDTTLSYSGSVEWYENLVHVNFVNFLATYFNFKFAT